MERNFDEWLNNFEDSIATWEYYVDFPKVYGNVEHIKRELNLLNSLIGSKNIEDEFKELVNEYPKVLSVIPILIAKREKVIIVKDAVQDYYFNFKNMNYSIEEYILFLRNTGIFDLLENHLISNLCDYVTGVEVGLDSNARKNRTGHSMENLVESYILKAGFVRDFNYFKELTTKKIKENWNIDLAYIVEKIELAQEKAKKKKIDRKAEKRFDFVIKTEKCLYVIETNFYGSQGSKLNETARSYKMLQEELKEIKNVCFVWLTDGKGWNTARHNLEETFNVMENIYSIKDLKNDIIKTVIK